ncbi:HD domain-containing phosphohydrolase [Uliginosibacterium sp. sgz301328]|uniref:HD domain-containing phosphohydrolase n=1 Tax=Uliginosibacterium sp. sgz301328 TaxID=3243764 RepID=UPI00359EBBC6
MAFALKRMRRYRLRVYIAALFLCLLIGFATILVAKQYQQTREMLLSASATLFEHITERIRTDIAAAYRPAVGAARLLAQAGSADLSTLPARLQQLPLMAQSLLNGPSISAIYIGYDSGDFFLLRRLQPDSALAQSFDAPKDSAFLIQSRAMENGEMTGRFLFFDANLGLLADRHRADYLYDPRTRPWYQEAHQRSGLFVTAPYLFFTTREIGATFAQRSQNGRAVAAVDVTLATLSETLLRLKPTENSLVFVFNEKGEVLSTSNRDAEVTVDANGVPHLPRASTMVNPLVGLLALDPAQRDGRPRALHTEGDDWQTTVSRLTEEGEPIYLAIAAPMSELLSDADAIRDRGLIAALIAVVIAVLMTWWLSKLASHPLHLLTAEAEHVRALKFDERPSVKSSILEIDDLAQSMAGMKTTIRKFLNVGQALASERDLNKLLDLVLNEASQLTHASGGVIYLLEPDKSLLPIVARVGETLIMSPATPIFPDFDSGHPAVRAVRSGSLHIPAAEASAQSWYPNLPTDREQALVSVPLRTRGGEALGVLIMSYDEAVFRHTSPQDVISLLEAVASFAAVSIEAQRMLQEQKDLLESFIQLVAGAIDAKNPYTAGHCQRVPELAKMLAHAADDATTGVFKDYRLSAEQWEELHIAAWLHDCGKVTTPEFVVDKATKLETLYDRIHEVRMRFEVLKREAEVACWRDIANGAERTTRLRELQESWAELDEEFAFVARSNHGGEFMAPNDVERLRSIGRRMWTRTLDDRLGLSHDELARKLASDHHPVPTLEPLLADRPEHIIARPRRERIASDNPWGIRMAVPENLYNRGELYNLSTPRGTLTPEERYKINEHIVETIRMLTRLPWPKHLSRVVDIAGSHHEKLDGTGYPRRLTADQMGTRSRIMAIADIFEALTAADRPYKTGKTLSEAVEIMARMRDERHIDADLFTLFLTSGVYLEYARRYLPQEQIDQVDLSRYVDPSELAEGPSPGNSPWEP